MTDDRENSENPADDMAEYLQTFLDETEEQLDDLVETMLALERDTTDKDDLNEAFRLIHSIKGSAGMMGFDAISVLTHHLENRFERFRSGTLRLDEPTMNLVLRCIDFLRQCNNRLRDGEQLGSASELLEELKRLEEQARAAGADEPKPLSDGQQDLKVDAELSQLPPSFGEENLSPAITCMVVRFRTGLPLADLKAQLIVARLSSLGNVKSTQPDLEKLSDADHLEDFEVWIETQEDLDHLRAAADVDGVESLEFRDASATFNSQVGDKDETDQSALADKRKVLPNAVDTSKPSTHQSITTSVNEPELMGDCDKPRDPSSATDVKPSEPTTKPQRHMVSSEPSAVEKTTTRVAETMRVDIDRLDTLMNLAGELVVNRARFVQIAGQINPALRKASKLNCIRDFGDSLRHTIHTMEKNSDANGDWSELVQQLRAGLELMEEQTELWDNGRHCFSQIGEAIDQLSRVSHSLQRGVLETRMVPVGPLFSRFNRVARDLSMERGKRVNLLIRGEKTELDKRMIDELGDPLMHLVRNSIDHGLEAPDIRVRRGKTEVGSITLEASHRGNNVYVFVRDDGGGIDVKKIKHRLVNNRILSESAAEELSHEQALEYIWHPGFSTAKEVTDVSGRGVGMDVAKTRISQLNGTIEVDSTQQGTTFTIRLPLTSAIINSLLVRLRNVIFSVPIDDVREIVSVKERNIVSVHGKQTFDVRGEFIPLASIDEIFQWHSMDYGRNRAEETPHIDSIDRAVDVVILHVGGSTMGLRVDELLGSQDIVIKSLSDNFIDIRGLSGASILGDGSVSLMLDVGAVIDTATRSPRSANTEKVAT